MLFSLCTKRTSSQARILLQVRWTLDYSLINHQERFRCSLQVIDCITDCPQTLQQAGVLSFGLTVRRRRLDTGLKSRRVPKKPLFAFKKNIKTRRKVCRMQDWTVEDWGKVCFSY
ncbi:hypothetical protein ILYODFUR_005862 [Ilyodon furcidens]|uniref:Uncharacterized protein n=1 Tax=Ilyodon furcidens TaxID=33524 RepID=A0ABV0UDP2_9TELE